MKNLIKHFIIYLILCIVVFCGILLTQKITNIQLNQLLPNIITLIFQVIILGLVFDLFDKIKKYKFKISLYNNIIAILTESLIRFNEPNNDKVDIDKSNFIASITLAKKNIGVVGMNNYRELINVLYSQRNAINGLLFLSLQISEVHYWLVTGLISTFTRMIDELEKINRFIKHPQTLEKTELLKLGFDRVFEIYLNNCEIFYKSKDKI